jgi:hypothetical protein
MKKEKQEKQFVKITGILAYPESAIEVDLNFGFLFKMELSDPLETGEMILDYEFGDVFIEFLEEQIWKRKEGAELDTEDILDEVEGKLSDYYVDGCRERGAKVYLVSESITKKEFNNSDKWKEPTEKECMKLLVNRYDD